MSCNTPHLVTVALPVLNGGALLELAVCSLLDQTWKKWELLILDDGSNDGAVDRIRNYNDARIVIIQDGCNLGLSSRLNQAISMANGKYFARLDHDDICHPERLARQVAFLENHPEIDLLATRCITIDEQDRITGELPSALTHDDICHRPWLGFSMPHPSWMGRINWFRNHSYAEPAPYCCEDQELLLRAHINSRYHTLPDYLLAYRIRSHTSWKKLWRTRLAMLREQQSYFFSRHQWTDVLLSLLMTGARISRDAWREVRHHLGPSTLIHVPKSIAPELFVQWHARITTLKQSIQAPPLK